MLSQNLIEALNSICPTEEEVKKVQQFKGSRDDLESSDLLVEALGGGNSMRVKALLFLTQYEETFQNVSSQLSSLEAQFDVLHRNPQLEALFEVVLGVGNFLNGGTSRGGAWGFSLDSVEKCADVKSSDNKLSLLMYVVEQVEANTQKAVLEGIDIAEVEVISRVPLSQLQSEISEMRKGAGYVQKAIDTQTDHKDDQVKATLSEYDMDITMKITDAEFHFKVPSSHSYSNLVSRIQVRAVCLVLLREGCRPLREVWSQGGRHAHCRREDQEGNAEDAQGG